MAELTDHETQLNNARLNLRDCLRRIEELLHEKTFSQPEREAELKEIISKVNWAIDYLYRAIGL